MTNGGSPHHGKRQKGAGAKKRGQKGDKTPLKRKSLLTAGLAKEKPDEVK
jgi:hypothetical protein